MNYVPTTINLLVAPAAAPDGSQRTLWMPTSFPPIHDTNYSDCGIFTKELREINIHPSSLFTKHSVLFKDSTQMPRNPSQTQSIPWSEFRIGKNDC